MMRAAALLVLSLPCFIGCDGGSSAGPPPTSRHAEPSVPVLPVPSASGILSSATTRPSASEPTASERPPPLRVAPRILAVSWEVYLGHRVSLACRPVRRIDFTRTVVAAGGEKFLVMGPPDVTPCGAKTSTFTVTGASTFAASGKTMLPELLLDEDGAQ